MNSRARNGTQRDDRKKVPGAKGGEKRNLKISPTRDPLSYLACMHVCVYTSYTHARTNATRSYIYTYVCTARMNMQRDYFLAYSALPKMP